MKKILIFLSVLLLSSQLYAKNNIEKFSIQNALNSNEAKTALDSDIKLIFGSGTTIGLIGQKLTSNAKSRSKKSAQESCNWAFLAAMKKFQAKAKAMGGTKVVNITSYYYKNPLDSKSEYECGVGRIVVGVTFQGQIAK